MVVDTAADAEASGGADGSADGLAPDAELADWSLGVRGGVWARRERGLGVTGVPSASTTLAGEYMSRGSGSRGVTIPPLPLDGVREET